MALVNPNIAMSFRQPEFKPRNALAEYAQIQQIMGGQRQAEMADMQMESLRRERDALGQIQAAIVAKGGPPDLEAAADAMIKTGRPEYLTQGMAIRTALRNQREAEAYRRDFGGGAAPAAAATPANAMVAPAAAAAPAPEGELVAAPIRPIPLPVTAPAAADAPAPAGETNLAYLQRQFGTPGGAAGPNALAPAAAPGTNAMAAPAAPTAAPDANATRLAALEAQYRRIGNNPELASEKALLLKQIEAALRADPSETRTMQQLGYPLTQEGYRQFRLAQMNLQEGAVVPIIGPDGRPRYATRAQAVGQTPFTPASVQVLGIGPQREPAAAASQKAPAGYRFTPGGDLEPIPGGPASPGLAPKDIQKREAAFPQAKQAVSTVRNTMSVIKETIDRLLENEAGLNGVTGLIGGITPGLTDAARQAVADLDQLKNLAFIQGITELRNASKTGAGVGNVSNKEGDRFENLKASLARSQSLKSMKDALKRLRDQADITDTTIQDAFDETYEYRTQRGAGGGGAAAPAAGGNTVTLPDGRVMTFPNAKAAADFKKAARLP